MKTELEQLKEQLNQISDKIKQLEPPSFQKGKWYKNRYGTIRIYNGHTEISYGFSCEDDSKWFYNEKCTWLEKHLWTPATDKEVEEALIKEAKKRGFKEGAKFKPVSGDASYLRNDRCEYLDRWYEYESVLFIDNYLIFANGIWAEIIKDEPLKVCGFEVKKDGEHYSIGCKNVSKKELIYFKDFMERNGYGNIQFSCYDRCDDVKLETINKILDL